MNPGATLPRLLKHAQTIDSKYCAMYYCAHESPISDLLTRPCLCILSLQHAGSFTQVPQFIIHEFWKAARKCGTGQADQTRQGHAFQNVANFPGRSLGLAPLWLPANRDFTLQKLKQHISSGNFALLEKSCN